YLDQTGALWAKGALVGKVASAMSSTATQHGGQEAALLSLYTSVLHHGMVIVGLPYAYQGQMGVDTIRGGSPYGATTLSAGDGSRQPSAQELEAAKWQGSHVAKIAAKLAK
ncbi:MAG: NAD(P)H:quinone oxidoreductase, partial [Aestuariivirga sp.]